jgi:hypothetical protein
MDLARRTIGHDDAQHIMEFIDADVRRLSEIRA